jgi:hypothetical protein
MEAVPFPDRHEPAISGGPAPPKPESPRRNRRLQRVADYRQKALANSDALVANLGAINSDLMVIAYWLMRATKTTLAHSSNPCEELASHLPAIQTCAQLTRQIARFAQLQLRWGEDQEKEPKHVVPAFDLSKESD